MPPSRTGFEQEYPFRSHDFDLDGLRYHYIDEGHHVDEGRHETLLFVHGNPTWSFAWRNLIKGLAPECRCVAVDHLGCGFSDKPQNYPYRLAQHIENLDRLVRRLDLARITLVAHDWGGAIGLGVIARLRERFARIVLCNTAAFRSQRIPLRIAVCRWPMLGALGVRGLNLFARAALSMAVTHHDRMTPEVCRGYLAPYGSWDDRVAIHRFVQDIPLHPSHPSYEKLVEVENSLAELAGKPVLLVWGERDWCFTPEFRQEFERRVPHAETFAIADAGHYVFEDAHERIVPRIREFLAAHRQAKT